MTTKRRPRLRVVDAGDDGPRSVSPCCLTGCPAAEQAEVAMLHYEIGVRTFCSGLRVDWAHVAYRMAQALAGEDGDAPEGRP